MKTGPTESSSELESKVLEAFRSFQILVRLAAEENEMGGVSWHPFLVAILNLSFLQELFDAKRKGPSKKLVKQLETAQIPTKLMCQPPHDLITILGAVSECYFRSELGNPAPKPKGVSYAQQSN